MPYLPCWRQRIDFWAQRHLIIAIISISRQFSRCFVFYLLFQMMINTKYAYEIKIRANSWLFSLFVTMNWLKCLNKKEYLVIQFTESHISWQFCFHYLLWNLIFFKMDLFWQTRTSISLWKMFHWKLTDMIQQRRG